MLIFLQGITLSCYKSLVAKGHTLNFASKRSILFGSLVVMFYVLAFIEFVLAIFSVVFDTFFIMILCVMISIYLSLRRDLNNYIINIAKEQKDNLPSGLIILLFSTSSFILYLIASTL